MLALIFGTNDRQNSEKYELAFFTKQQCLSVVLVRSGFAGGLKQGQTAQTGTLTRVQSTKYGIL
jgi:hypothetical protein